ncbi:hypothetical protein BU251_00210 [Candidatus Velamenicoccus archaeovorus]|uniref:Uncharacterized protein n=1 Tax=Velamenicoccus archaeovorus TaxID=1930593 RepID=A0A410P2E8_VELA1|nr:hypothetical protein [Candidatus Velamenicoccus archaeovorus]QAT16271.1 hypothetical protein BU251_00210 [Candidatus Velamenicoccus archaeovorus]
MRKWIVGLAVLLAVGWNVCAAEEKAAEEKATGEVKSFPVYTDAKSPDNHYIPSGWMGDFGDLSMDDKYMGDPHSGSTSIKFVYTAKKTQNQGWAGVYWQNPANNWGSKKGGFDLTGLNKLTLWMRGDKGGEVIDKIAVGGIKGTYPDTTEVSVGPIELTTTWTPYTVNLAGKDLSYINGALCWVANADSNPNGATFYIDDIKFEYDPALKPAGKKTQEMPFYIYADKGSIQNHFIPSGWMGDYSDLKIDVGSTDNPYFGKTCIKITYDNKATNGARWAGMYWQYPANNWGGVDGGFDLSRAKKLTFWARGEKGGERIEEFKVGGIMGEYSDSDTAGIGPVVLDKEWKQYTIDLTGKDLSYIIGGFAWATNLDVNPDGAVFYLDEIKYE